ncbi:hypothetical protein KBY66_08890 [Synechococcus sp. Tobar12-5m-g]|uniref:hypothetical protein n=1 Tax=unclassified Synechococcus TaxID=2626047 RepID=UPI0020CBBB8A|nr:MULTISPECIES: hypothetical protein [unclassified Synechococcus]MCP9772741.1 hypothetical protein [Synechococcus sp. Tobar12-5m-g]MCP9873622.1 hypothetical protein [Synechococcus sp. Cruz CV-v-12]
MNTGHPWPWACPQADEPSVKKLSTAAAAILRNSSLISATAHQGGGAQCYELQQQWQQLQLNDGHVQSRGTATTMIDPTSTSCRTRDPWAAAISNLTKLAGHGEGIDWAPASGYRLERD